MSPQDKLKQQTARLSILSNTALTAAKLLAGLSLGARSLVSEGLHSGADLLASLIAYWTVKKAAEPPDREHDYGHGKFENLSAFFEAGLIIMAGVGIIWDAAVNFGASVEGEYLEYGIAVSVLSIVINLGVSRRLLKVGRQTHSQALVADGLHLSSDVWTSLGVTAGLVAIEVTGQMWVDSAIAIVVGCIILRAGARMLREAMGELTDRSLSAAEEARLKAILESGGEVISCHALRTRKSGSKTLLDAHVVFRPDSSLEAVHRACDALEEAIRREVPGADVLLHPEPPEPKEPIHQTKPADR